MFMSEDVSVLEFINAFKYYVSMYVGKEVDYLKMLNLWLGRVFLNI